MISLSEAFAMIKKCMLLLVTAVGLFAIAPAYAHHGSASYDGSKTIVVKGSVTAFNFTNPHVLISVDVKDTSGNVEKWEGELTSPNHLARAGWSKNTLKPGDQVTLTGTPAKSGAPTMIIRKVVKNGEEIELGSE
jgi:hypothetical protein